MFVSFLLSFLLCGFICVIAQIILDNSKLTTGHVTSLFVVLGAILEFFDLYEPLRKTFNMGATLPISSFGSVIMKGVKQSIDNYDFIGIFKGVFDNCGVLISFALFLAFIAALIFKPKS